MSFQSLKVDELQKVADFFVVDVNPAGEKATKKELLAALAAGDEPVTWDDYQNIYLAAEKPEDEPVEEEPKKETPKTEDKYKDSEKVLIKYDRKNPTYSVLGYTFTKRHPFASVPQEVAEHLVRNVEGFRLALPSEVTDYYG